MLALTNVISRPVSTLVRAITPGSGIGAKSGPVASPIVTRGVATPIVSVGTASAASGAKVPASSAGTNTTDPSATVQRIGGSTMTHGDVWLIVILLAAIVWIERSKL